MAKPDHRELAVEAAARSLYLLFGDEGWQPAGPQKRSATKALVAAEPHLQRMFFERFKEAMLSEGAYAAADALARRTTGHASDRGIDAAIRAALDQAERLMEDEDA